MSIAQRMSEVNETFDAAVVANAHCPAPLCEHFALACPYRGTSLMGAARELTEDRFNSGHLSLPFSGCRAAAAHGSGAVRTHHVLTRMRRW